MSISSEGGTGRRSSGVRMVIGLSVLAVLVAAVAVLVAVLTSGTDDGAEKIVTDIVDPVAPVGLADGGFLVAERTTGRVLRATPEGELTETVQITDELATDGQRGVLGLAVRRSGEATEVYASWTRASDGRLVVGRLVDQRQELVWEGPVSSDLANGGTLAFREGILLVAVGELEDPAAVDDPSTPNGKILGLDPEQGPEQQPTTVATGWHNPFAMAVVGDTVWLADNAPGAEPERLVRIDPSGDVTMLDLEGKRAPSSLDVLPDGDLVLCGFVSGVVERIPVPEVGVEAPTDELGPPCATGVAVLADGSIVTTTADAIWRDPDIG